MNKPDPNSDSKPDAELDSLFALARARRADTSKAEYGFETRLMARLRSRSDAGSVWAMVSWRFIPFLTACVVGLTIWQAQVASDANLAATVAGLNNPFTAEVEGD